MTHKQKVLALLRDGKPHTHHEVYALGCVAHSRISDLRRDGHTITCTTETSGGVRVSVYQLVGSLEEPSSIPHGTIAHTPSGSMGVRGGEGSSSETADHGMPPSSPSSGAVSLSLFDDVAA